MGLIQFGAPRELVLWMRDAFNIHTFVETGTNRAETSVWASDHFERVFSIEAYEPLHQQAVQSHGNRQNLTFLLGDSRVCLKPLIEELKEPALFWLDAHWCGQATFGKSNECPVLGELALLNECAVPHVVLVDDARLFMAPPPPPHEAGHWPDISALCAFLARADFPRYVAVHEDVIIAVPETGKSLVVDYLRTAALQKLVPPQKPMVRSLRQRLENRLAKLRH
jgi:hypothetical protein